MVIKAVIGANYGDEGKGLMTDYFCHQSFLAKERCLNVLTNGGAQRGHTVVHKGKHHVFHHFGSGTFSNADTYIHQSYIVNPAIFVAELESLNTKCAFPKVYVNNFCMVTTPFDMMYNQIVVDVSKKHNSCGRGIWNTITRYENTKPICFYISDFFKESEAGLREILESIRDYYSVEFEENNIQLSDEQKRIFYDDGMIVHFIHDISVMKDNVSVVNKFVDDLGLFKKYDVIVLENAQGLLLDKDFDKEYGTPSHTGVKGFECLIDYLDDNIEGLDIEVCYVSRSYLTRHGDGYLPNECCQEEIALNINEKTNLYNHYQGCFRYAKLNIDNLLNNIKNDFSKLSIGACYSLAITHLDEFDISGGIGLKNNNFKYLSYSPDSIKVKEV